MTRPGSKSGFVRSVALLAALAGAVATNACGGTATNAHADAESRDAVEPASNVANETNVVRLESFLWSVEERGAVIVEARPTAVRVVATSWGGDVVWEKDVASTDRDRRFEIRISEPGYFKLVASDGTHRQESAFFVFPVNDVGVPDEFQKPN